MRHTLVAREGLALAAVAGPVHHHVGAELDKHGDLIVARSFQITGDLPETVTFDFVGTGADQMVHVFADVEGRRVCGLWKVSAVQDRNVRELDGFKEFADMLERTGAQLAHIIMGLRA